ncbi:hypothetical protein CORC01_08364 [Colletotrichum orchidophilum]|uniref:Uncharacterized protein n=1 Tax=Colletotrichum orchidophilum TaxID=1209926 RepID=A0A1G4B4T7_9PEZI|nr:uncharacterized protein CORC01_08364 [Colletotrichum orchidophilum]OHE96292.1 hypothetical protein CORC01_08364 [Colletotrichum orchidophilum]
MTCLTLLEVYQELDSVDCGIAGDSIFDRGGGSAEGRRGEEEITVLKDIVEKPSQLGLGCDLNIQCFEHRAEYRILGVVILHVAGGTGKKIVAASDAETIEKGLDLCSVRSEDLPLAVHTQ